jgi:hypothetical protein
MNILSLFHKDDVKIEESMYEKEKNFIDKYIYCEILWDKVKNEVVLNRYNRLNNEHDSGLINHFSRNVKFNRSFYVPKVIFEVDWLLIAKYYKDKLLKWVIEFTNYSHPNTYSILMKATKLNNRVVVDGFSSIQKSPIYGEELFNNIKTFFDFVISLKK